MESTHHGAHAEHGARSAATEHEHEHGHDHPEEDWNDEEYVAYWLERQTGRAEERRRHFMMFRALITKMPEDEFSYINLGAGPGYLDEVLLEQFPGAQCTLVDGSLPMLVEARKRLERFGERVEYVQANLATPDWAGAVTGPFDFAVSSIAIHNLRDPRRIRDLYAETFRLTGHGGMFLNLDYVRPARPSLAPLGPWVAKDHEAGLRRGGGHDMPGTLIEQLGWLSEAGFSTVDVVWKNMNTVLLCGLRDHLHMPEGEGGHAAEGAHGHSH
ncbi:MAG: methyltransferase domain-containing protein [Dehalococcoidia bacterium]|nr:methyltransferase domain-containing protein [Dehalococcoidia bacterium]